MKAAAYDPMHKGLSHIVAGHFSAVKPGEDLSPRLQRLRDAVQAALESDDTVFGKYRGLLASLREIIPDEQQRNHAAFKALSTTLRMGREEIVRAVDGQLADLRSAEQDLLARLPGRDGLNTTEERLRRTRAEIVKLQGTIDQLRQDELEFLASKAQQEKEWGAVDAAVSGMFAGIGAELAAFKKKMEELPAEGVSIASAPPKEAVSVVPAVPLPQQGAAATVTPAEQDDADGKTAGAKPPPAAPIDPRYQRKCPMCGGPFNLLEHENLWQCFSCGHEEAVSVAANARSEPEAAVPPREQEGGAPPEPKVETLADMVGGFRDTESAPASPGRPSVRKKTCPSCRGKMFWYDSENAWRCNTCGYETRTVI